jgi:hypothetical protein
VLFCALQIEKMKKVSASLDKKKFFFNGEKFLCPENEKEEFFNENYPINL